MSLVDTLRNLTSSDPALRAEAQLTVKKIQDSKQVGAIKALCLALTGVLHVNGTTQVPPSPPPAPEGESMCINSVGIRMYEMLADALEGDDDEEEEEEEDPFFLFARDSDVALDFCLAGLTHQFGESEDDSRWTIDTAASQLLQAILQNRHENRNETVAKLMNFANQRHLSPLWQLRDAAFLVTGCVCSCPDDDFISNLITTTIMPILLKSIGDTSLAVADSVLWAIASICENYHEAIIDTPEYLPSIMTAVVPLISKPRAPGRSARALQVIHNLAKNCADEADDKGVQQTNHLSPFLPSLLSVVVGCIQQGGGGQTKNRLSAVETLTMLVGATAADCVHVLTDWSIVRDLVLPRLNKLHSSAAEGADGSDDPIVESVETACLCGTIVTLCKRLGVDIAPVSSTLFEALIGAVKVWESTGNGCLEDGLMAVAALFQSEGMNKSGGNNETSRSQIAAILSVLVPVLSSQNREQLTAALACISDIVFWAQEDFVPHLPLVMPVLIPMLKNKELHDEYPSNKIAVFRTVGDISISCGIKAGDQYCSSIKVIFEAEAEAAAKNDDDGEDQEELMEIISETLEIMCC